ALERQIHAAVLDLDDRLVEDADQQIEGDALIRSRLGEAAEFGCGAITEELGGLLLGEERGLGGGSLHLREDRFQRFGERRARCDFLERHRAQRSELREVLLLAELMLEPLEDLVAWRQL